MSNRPFPHDFYTHFIYLHDEPPLHIQQLIMDNQLIAHYFEEARSVKFRSTAFRPPRNRLPKEKEHVELTIEWGVGETEVVTLRDATYNGE